jgi:two-component system response regulator (stage 0 sporulation protein A)
MNSQVSTISCKHSNSNSNFESKVIKTLLKLGIPANTKGFHYIKTAVLLGVETPIGLTSMSKILYPAIAELYHVRSAASIERAMRYAIGLSCVKGDAEFICEMFYFNDNIQYYSPTNREFLAVVVEYIKQFRTETTESLIAS